MDINTLLPLIVASVLTVVTAVFGTALVYLRKQLRVAGERAGKATGFYQTVTAVVELIDDILVASHAHIIKQLEDKLADGKLDSKEVVEIVQSVKLEVLAVLNDRALDDLKFITDDIEYLIETKVKNAISMFFKRF